MNSYPMESEAIDFKPFEIEFSDIRLRALERLYTDEQRLEVDTADDIGHWKLKRMKNSCQVIGFLFSGLGKDGKMISVKSAQVIEKIDTALDELTGDVSDE